VENTNTEAIGEIHLSAHRSCSIRIYFCQKSTFDKVQTEYLPLTRRARQDFTLGARKLRGRYTHFFSQKS